MGANDLPSSDQFARTKEELRKLSSMVEEIQRCVDVSTNIETFEARQALDRARVDIMTAGFWIGEALKYLAKKTKAAAR